MPEQWIVTQDLFDRAIQIGRRQRFSGSPVFFQPSAQTLRQIRMPSNMGIDSLPECSSFLKL